jgi:adenylate cyclase
MANQTVRVECDGNSIGSDRPLRRGDLSDTVGTRQKLAAILAADAAGYSRLMALDERGTVDALDAARGVFRAQIESHHGRVIDMAGDSVLALFETATGAVSAALAVQAELEARLAGVPADRRMRFRIGVHLGDVIEKADGSVYGDGVNIAARLEGLAQPGGITVSDAVQGAVRRRIGATFEDLGEQSVKNIADPVRAYRVLAATNGGAPASRKWPASILPFANSRRGLVVAASIVMAAAALGMATWQMRGGAQGTSVSPITMSLAIGVIAAPTNDAATVQAAKTLEQALETGISAVARHVRIVSVDRGANAAATIREAARQAGARYVVEGDLQAAAPQRLLSLRLIETARGTQVWSGQSELPEAAGTVQSHAAIRKVVGRLAFAVGTAEVGRVLPKPLGQLDAMERVVRAFGILTQGQSLAIANEARELLEAALRLEPTLLPGLWMMSWPLDMAFALDPHPDRDRLVREMDEYSVRAVTLDPDIWLGWAARSTALLLLGRWTASLEASERQIKLDLYNASSYSQRAWLLIMMGQPADALPLLEHAVALDRSPSGETLLYECQAQLLLGVADKAVATCERASGLDPNDFMPHAFLAAAHANKGDIKQAQAALQVVLRALPGCTIAQLHAKRYSDHPEYKRLAETYWYAGLRRAGLPEQ